jgi:hypothetical protein
MAEYQGTVIRKAHRTIYIHSEHDLTPEEIERLRAKAEELGDGFKEDGIDVSIGSEYYSETKVEID